MPNSKAPRFSKIARLFAQLAWFRPTPEVDGQWDGKFLVNQNHKIKAGETTHPPDRDELLHMIGEGSIEIKTFIDEHERVKKEFENLTAEFLALNLEMNSAIGSMEGLPTIQRMQTVVGRYRQMYDLLHSIAHNLPENLVKGKALQFLQWKGESIALVNQNEKETTQVDAASGEPVCTCPPTSSGSFSCPVHGDNAGPVGTWRLVFDTHDNCPGCWDTHSIHVICETCGGHGHTTEQHPTKGPTATVSEESVPPKDEPFR